MPDRKSQSVPAELDESRSVDLLNRVQRGDREAFAKLYTQFHPRLYGYLLRFLSNPAMVDEVLDDVMFVVWKDARKFRGRSKVSTWIFGIAYRKALTAIRSDRRYQSGLDRGADLDAVAGASSRHEEWLRAGLRQLSPDHRQVLELTYYGGFSYEEISEIAGCPVNTVKTRMFHARRRLKVILPRLAGQAQEQNRERS